MTTEAATLTLLSEQARKIEALEARLAQIEQAEARRDEESRPAYARPSYFAKLLSLDVKVVRFRLREGVRRGLVRSFASVCRGDDSRQGRPRYHVADALAFLQR